MVHQTSDFAARITLKELRDMSGVGEILEMAAMERAARRIDSDRIQALKAVRSASTREDDAS